MSLSQINLAVQIALGAVGLLAASKSAYNGLIYKYFLRRLRLAEEAHKRTKELDEKVDDVANRQELQTDVLIALGESINGERDFDADEYRRLAGRDDPNRFFDDE